MTDYQLIAVKRLWFGLVLLWINYIYKSVELWEKENCLDHGDWRTLSFLLNVCSRGVILVVIFLLLFKPLHSHLYFFLGLCVQYMVNYNQSLAQSTVVWEKEFDFFGFSELGKCPFQGNIFVRWNILKRQNELACNIKDFAFALPFFVSMCWIAKTIRLSSLIRITLSKLYKKLYKSKNIMSVKNMMHLIWGNIPV